MTDQNSVIIINAHWLVWEEIAEKEMEVALYSIDIIMHVCNVI